MDIETKRELERLRRIFEGALDEVRLAHNDQDTVDAWRKIQIAGWELNALLPSQSRSSAG